MRPWAVVTLIIIVPLIVMQIAYLWLTRDTSGTDASGPRTCATWGLSESDTRAHPAPAQQSEGVRLYATHNSEETTGKYHLFDRGVDYSQPVGLVVRLHGDGAWEYDNPELLPNCMAEVAASHNMVLLVPQAPDEPAAGKSRTWWNDIPHNREWVTSLINEVLAENPRIDDTNIMWVGYSGGAEFISYGLLTQDTGLVNRGTILTGGGGASSYTRVEGLPDPERTEARHRWYVGKQDTGVDPRFPFNAVRAAERGEEFYDEAGFTDTEVVELRGQGHLDMPHLSILDDELEATAPEEG